MRKLRAQLASEGIQQAWLDNNHALMRFMASKGFDYKKTLTMLRCATAHPGPPTRRSHSARAPDPAQELRPVEIR